jgi:hypothetical protein
MAALINMFSFAISIDLIGWLVGWQYEASWDVFLDASVLQILKLRKRYNYHATEIEIKTFSLSLYYYPNSKYKNNL